MEGILSKRDIKRQVTQLAVHNISLRPTSSGTIAQRTQLIALTQKKALLYIFLAREILCAGNKITILVHTAQTLSSILNGHLCKCLQVVVLQAKDWFADEDYICT